MNPFSKATLKSLFLPGGLLLLIAALLLQGGIVTISAAVINTFYYVTLAAGVLLAWRFHSSRLLFTFLVLLLSQRALAFFSSGHSTARGPGHIAFEAICLLLPLNLIFLAQIKERGLALPNIASRLALIFLESVFVAALCGRDPATSPAFLHPAFVAPLHGTSIPQLAWLAFGAAFVVLLTRFFVRPKPLESGMLWALLAAFLGLQVGGVGPIAVAYAATAALMLVSSIVENSYTLAYQDELTSLPSRRAFNEALLSLDARYSIAVVDIDHFKKFNDTYGHDTGDQVLRLVASRLATVTGGGKAYRVGGEEFSILFPEKSIPDALPHLEALRAQIEASMFKVRGGKERRALAVREPAGPAKTASTNDRRSSPRRTEELSVSKTRRKRLDVVAPAPSTYTPASNEKRPDATREISVTVSIGVAHATARIREPEAVIRAADKALYRAKKSGRNRVEAATSARATERPPKKRITA